MAKQVLSILVENTSGVTSHISGLFSRRGYNIDSFSSGVTSDPRVTRITIVCSGDEQILEQIEKQVAKLEDVIHIKKLDPKESVIRELALINVKVAPEDRPTILSICDIFRGKVVDVQKDSIMIEITADEQKLTAFLNLLEGFEILEIARTGITALSRKPDEKIDVEI